MPRLGRFGVDRMMILRTHLRRAPPILSRSACIDETLGCQAVLAPGGAMEEIGYSAPGGRGVCVSSSSCSARQEYPRLCEHGERGL